MKHIFCIAVLLFHLLPVGNLMAQPFAADIAAFKKADSVQAPPAHPILFVGSSSFTFWKDVQQYFPGKTILNRGFGGSSLVDLTRYANDIIFPYAPRQVVMYCGENDFAASDTVSVATVVGRFTSLFTLIRNRLPGVPFTYISMKPSPAREKLMPAFAAANEQIRRFLSGHPHTSYVDVFTAMLDDNGKPRQDIFVQDRLHMNANGYAIWQKLIAGHLK